MVAERTPNFVAIPGTNPPPTDGQPWWYFPANSSQSYCAQGANGKVFVLQFAMSGTTRTISNDGTCNPGTTTW